ncbi:MAG TPA: hypothetical protein VHR64_15535 [Thermomicrobiales bacterium]|nr:hypothetical protein [Thermomicrobiales bacterium]
MVEQFERDDPERSASYRAATLVAARHQIGLTAWREGRQWAVRAAYHDGVREAVTVTGRTAADAAWHALDQILRGMGG